MALEVVDRFAVDIYLHSNALEGTVSAGQIVQALSVEYESQYAAATAARTSRSGRRSRSVSSSESGLRPIRSGHALNELLIQDPVDELKKVVGDAHAAPLRRHLATVRTLARLTTGYHTSYSLRLVLRFYIS